MTILLQLLLYFDTDVSAVIVGLVFFTLYLFIDGSLSDINFKSGCAGADTHNAKEYGRDCRK